MNAFNEYNLDHKTAEFTHAIEHYLNKWYYKRIENLVSFLITTLQIISLFNVFYTCTHTHPALIFITLIGAYIAADLVNGLVHMYMDNNIHYTSIVGPFIAAFHLHHAKYFYQVRHPLKVYYDESGTKFWLLAYLIIVVCVQYTTHLNTLLNVSLVAFAIFSSVAELSHYWCHNASQHNKIITWLQSHHLLLSKQYHKAHHCSDNIQYAFLNGVSDPLINWLARRYYKGYKNYADKHTKAYFR